MRDSLSCLTLKIECANEKGRRWMIDLRSDTVTRPTEEMRKAMYEAEVGDDVYGEDPTVNRLEALAADLFGKEAALFVTSGTQGNQLAVLAHCFPGQEIILEAESHIFLYEAGAVSALAGVQTRTISGTKGQMDPEQIERAIREPNIHHPVTGLICLENTHNKAGGRVLPLSYLKEVKNIATRHQIPIHLDGARIFNASVATGVAPRMWGEQVDSIQVCLSKGLSAPVGSLLIGSKQLIEKARIWRKRLGGGMRQVGVLAAPGIIALTQMVERLAEDHHHAKKLAIGLSEIKGISVDVESVETNIILVNITATGLTNTEFLQRLKSQGILAGGFGEGIIRFVTHREISSTDIEKTLMGVQKALQ